MIIDLRLPAGTTRTWHVQLAAALAAMPGVTVQIGRGRAAGRTATLLFALETFAYGRGRPMLSDPAPETALADRPAADGTATLVVDVTGADPAGDGRPVLALTSGGLGVDDGVLAAVLAGGVPTIALDHIVDGRRRPLARWTLAVENRRAARAAVEGGYGRAAQLAALTVARLAGGQPLVPDAAAVAATTAAAAAGSGVGAVEAAAFSARALARRIEARLQRVARTAPRWFVALRQAETSAVGLPALGRGAPFRRLPDDGGRFFADPFVWRQDGRTVVFVEELPFATNKGIIAAFDVADDGRMGQPFPVLETASHLSYPHVFAHDGQLWMIPESSTARTVELWRCSRFPDVWEHHAVLIAGRDLSDATVAEIDGRWVMFCTAREPATSTWEALDIWTAPALTGPWTPMPDNPVLVDARSARPAGALFRDGERWIRPVQICDDRYGAGLAFAAIDRIDGFRQTLVRSLKPPKPNLGLHTFNRGAGLEVIDLIGPPGGGDPSLG